MDEQNPQSPDSPKRRTHGAAVATRAFVVLAAGASLLVYYRYRQEVKSSSTTNLSGFDIAQSQTPAEPQSPVSQAPAVAPQPADGGMSLIRGGFAQPAQNSASASPEQKADASLAAACRAHGGEVQALAVAYTKKYPIIAQYGRDWMSYPDLRKLAYGYAKNQDPISFIKGVAASPNFRILVRKYAAQPAIQSFAKDVVTHAPADVLSAASNYLNDNRNMTSLADTVLTALGLPPGIIGASGSGSPKINTGAMIQGLLNNPPQQQGGAPTLSPP
ncbi:MAG TPA: hypothetical protein VNK24_01220 [Elusimicrobiota bacterium]|nr:hypothetical protein [Elusimicrobiota bacterium]